MEKPEEFSPEWNDWVLTHLTDDEVVYNDELKEKLPRAIGLRRISQLIYGPIKSSRPVDSDITQCQMGMDILTKHTVMYEVEFENGRKYGDVAECWELNTPVQFLAHAAASACTRAEARTLKKALGLKGLTAEEMTKPSSEVKRETAATKKDGITNSQVTLITNRTASLGIDLKKFISTWDKNNYNDIQDVPKSVAAKMIKSINTYMNGHEDIPEEVKL